MSRQLLKCKLRISQLETEVRGLRDTLKEETQLLHQANKLLQKYSPSRPHLTSDQKMLIAAKWRFRCANTVDGQCPLYKLPPKDGVFESCYEIDHILPFCESPIGPLQPLCSRCHALKSLRHRAFRSTLRERDVPQSPPLSLTRRDETPQDSHEAETSREHTTSPQAVRPRAYRRKKTCPSA